MSSNSPPADQRGPQPAPDTSPADAIETGSAEGAGKSLFDLAKQVVKGMGAAQLTTQAQSVAYNFIFAIVPLLIFITALAATISKAVYSGTDQAVQKIINQLADRLPANSQTLVHDLLQTAISQAGGGAITIGAVLALIGARGAMGSLIGALNAAYQVQETRGFVHRNLLAIGLTLGSGLGIIVSIILFVGGKQIGEWVSGPLGLGDAWVQVWNILRFPLVLVILVAALAALYWAGPNTTISFRWLSAGAIFAVIGWVVVTLFLNLYFQYAGSYASAYGTFGGVLAFIFYLYLISLILLIGGEINATLARRVPQAGGQSAGIGSDRDTSMTHVIRQAREALQTRRERATAASHAAVDATATAGEQARDSVKPATSSTLSRSRDPAQRTAHASRSMQALGAAIATTGAGIAAVLLRRRR